MHATADLPRRLPPLALPRGWTGRAVLALATLLLVATALQPWWLAPALSHYLTAESGREVRFESARVGLSAALEPVVHAHGVHIDNAAWADDPTRPFAALGEFIAVVSWRSLAEARPVIGRMILRDGAVDLERQADGLRNWRLRNPENRGPGRYKVLALQAERATVRFHHGGLDLVFEAKATARGADQTLPTQIEFAGRWRGLPFDASVATGPVLSFVETGDTFPLRGHVGAGGARLDIDGRAGDLFHEPIFDADIVFAADTLAPFHAFVGSRYDGAPRKALRVAARLKAAGHALSLAGAKLRVGTTDLAGDLSVDHRGERRTVHTRLGSDSTDLADLRWLAGHAAAAADDPFAWARGFDADFAFAARKLHAAEAPWLRSLDVAGTLDQGRMALSRIEAGVLGGHASGSADIDLRGRAAAADGGLSLRGVPIEALLREPPEHRRLTGVLRADGRLKASGDSAQAMLASASGSVAASLSSGTISSLLDAEIGLQGGRVVRTLIGGAEPIPIRCAAVTMDVRGGAGVFRSLVLDTERTRTTGSGGIDLRKQTLDVVLTPEAKQGGLFVLDRSIRVHGPLHKPARELVARARTGIDAGKKACPA